MTSFDDFFQQLSQSKLANYEEALLASLTTHFKPETHGDWQNWQRAYESLPTLYPNSSDLCSDTVRIGCNDDIEHEQRQQLECKLKSLHPWRKGPYNLFGTFIDTEWRSDWKWHRIQPHIAPLKNKTVLDVGCGSGYHCWRMRGDGARFVLGIDPSLKFLMQFRMIKKYLPTEPVFLLPLCSEEMPERLGVFDTVFSMGVLYHRRSPFDHLDELMDFLCPGGELVLETLVIDGKTNEVLVPEGRYAQMRNVWFIPSCETLCGWLKRSGFCNIRVVDVNQTSCEEQRSTPWMQFHSLQDYLAPNNSQLTVEGLPAPKRAIILANKPA